MTRPPAPDSPRPPLPLLAALALAGAMGWVEPAWAGGGEGNHTVITNIALCMVAAGVAGMLVKLLRQPLILGYLLAGVAIGPIGLRLIHDHAEIVTVAEIGLILLLFMIGLEIDLKKMLSSGRLVIVTGILQFPLTVLVGWGIFQALDGVGWGPGSGYGALYGAIAVAISSTMVVVKLLYEKRELDTLPGRITLGILVFQDIWAIIVLALQPNFDDPRVGGILATFGAGAALVAVALACSRHLLPRLFHLAAKAPELMLILALGWCFTVALVAAHPRVGLSMEMGALIAGVSLATFPYNIDVIAKVISIRDFFITLFFVALGMQIPPPRLPVLEVAAVLVAALVLTRLLGVFGVLHLLGAGHRTGLTSAINLTQMSEFSLVILSLGVGFGHLGPEALTPAIWAFSLMAVASTYLVQASHPLQSRLSGVLTRVGVKDLGGREEEHPPAEERTIILLGFYRVASALLWDLRERHQQMLEQIAVIDFNPLVRERLATLGIPCIYGDIAHLDTIHHAAVEHARVVLCTIPDHYLKGTTNLKLLKMAKSVCPHAHVVVTASSPRQARVLYEQGADWVILPHQLAGGALAEVLEGALYGGLEVLREEGLQSLIERHEVLR